MTQAQQITNELEKRKNKFGRKSWLSVREIETNLNINSAYSVMGKVKKIINLEETSDMNLVTGKGWKLWRKK